MKISKDDIDKLINLGSIDQEIICCQDHCYRIYSNYLNAYLEKPFKSYIDAEKYTYQLDDEWDFSNNINY